MSHSRIRSTAERGLRTTVKVVAGAADLVRRPASGVVILLYHRVGGGTHSSSTCRPGCSTSRWRGSRRRAVVSLGDALDALRQRARRCARRRHLRRRHRRLRRVAFRSSCATGSRPTLYLATRSSTSSGRSSRGRAVVVGRGARGLFDRPRVDRLAHPHAPLARPRARAEVADELDRSIGSIGDNLGAAPRTSPTRRRCSGRRRRSAAVRSRFRSAALAGTRANVAGQTPTRTGSLARRSRSTTAECGSSARWRAAWGSRTRCASREPGALREAST